MSSSYHTRSPSMSSWTITIMAVLLSMMACIPTKASTIEHCLRLALHPPLPPPPPPPHAARAYLSSSDWTRILCRDQFRVTRFSIQATKELPLDYLVALCNIFGHDEQKVEGYIIKNVPYYDFHRLMAGRSCATIRNK